MATLLKLINRFEGKSTTNAAIILALVVIASYSHIIFLDQSINQSLPIRPELLGYNKKSTIFATTIDPPANFEATWPDNKLATTLFLEGKIPLWNPYIALGQPLAADTQHYIFSPLILGYLLPVQFWDVPLLIALWLAGIFTFLFLRNIGLNFLGSISGGIFYMFSGVFTWWLPGVNVTVIIFTPLILYSLEKIIQNRNLKYMILASAAFSLGILGAHLESIILQFLLAGLYLFYRILRIAQSGKHKKLTDVIPHNDIITHGPKRILSFSVLSFIGGLGLSAFFILPVYEFTQNAWLEHSTTVGLEHVDLISLSTLFVPYILGPLRTPIIQNIPASWETMFGYAGMFSLFFSIIGVWFSLKNKDNYTHKYTPLFFFIMAILFIMKVVGVPIVNWIGYLPILNMLKFNWYSGEIIVFGFAVAAAFGINLLSTINMKKKTLGITFIISISSVLLSLLLFLYLTDDTKFLAGISLSDARKYIIFQILQATAFAFIAFLLSIAVLKNKSAIIGIIPLVLLELYLYIPVGLDPIWSAYKSIIVISGMVVITFLVSKPNRFTWYMMSTKKVKFYIIIGVLIVTVSGGLLISQYSAFGMMKKYDSFQKDPLTDFLKENLGTYRMFSFDHSLGRNFPAAYKISSIVYSSPFRILSFDSFDRTFLNKQVPGVEISKKTWNYYYGPMESISKFLENKKYFDFLGVKYVLTEGYNFNTFAPGRSATLGQYTKIESQENSTGQSFTSPYDSIAKIGISLSTLELEDTGDMILTVDSIPRDEKHHRESIINKTVNQRLNEFEIKPPLTDVLNKQLYMSLKYPEAANNKLALVYTHGENQTGFNIIKNELNGTFYKNGIPVVGKQMVFSITPDSNKHPVAFQFHDIYINENTEAFPRAFLVNKFQVVDKDKAQDFLFKNPDLDLRQKVVLEEQLPEEWTNLLESSSIENSAEIVSYSANEVVIHTNNKDASLLVLTDVYYPGWKAFVDGSETHIYRADGLVRAIFIPSGNHTVEFLYQPQSFLIGTIISLSTAAVLIGIFIHSKRKNS